MNAKFTQGEWKWIDGGTLSAGPLKLILACSIGPKDDDAKLIKAGPKMAEALLALVSAAPKEEVDLVAKHGPTPGCLWCSARAVLRKAGVLE